MKIISFSLFFNPGATTHLVYIESNSHTYPGNTPWAWTGEVLSSCVKWHQEKKIGQTLKFFVLNDHSCVRNNTWFKNVSYVDTAFSTTESLLTHCTAPTGVHFDRGGGEGTPLYGLYIRGWFLVLSVLNMGYLRGGPLEITGAGWKFFKISCDSVLKV